MPQHTFMDNVKTSYDKIWEIMILQRQLIVILSGVNMAYSDPLLKTWKNLESF